MLISNFTPYAHICATRSRIQFQGNLQQASEIEFEPGQNEGLDKLTKFVSECPLLGSVGLSSERRNLWTSLYGPNSKHINHLCLDIEFTEADKSGKRSQRISDSGNCRELLFMLIFDLSTRFKSYTQVASAILERDFPDLLKERVKTQ